MNLKLMILYCQAHLNSFHLFAAIAKSTLKLEKLGHERE